MNKGKRHHLDYLANDPFGGASFIVLLVAAQE